MIPFDLPLSGSKILIVDDEPGTIKVLAQMLKPLGKVFFTTRPTDAVRLAQSVDPDIILLDIEMPDADGFKVCQQLRADPALQDIPILFVTGHTDTETETRALQTCALDFIHKPPHPEIVRARVRNYLSLKHQRDQLRKLSLIDGLTGIANRRAFDKTLRHEWRRACRQDSALSLLLIDVDYFKRYNDTFGHLMGDACLKAIAQALLRQFKRPSDLVARFGGEEFAVLLPDCPLTQALMMAEQTRLQVMQMECAQQDIPLPDSVTISIGVAGGATLCAHAERCWRHHGSDAAFPSCGADPEQLIVSADEALYLAKRSGRNQVQPSGERLKGESQ